MLTKVKEEIFIKFEERFIGQNRKTDELEMQVSFQENILIQCDNNERYSWHKLFMNLKKNKKNNWSVSKSKGMLPFC